MRCTTLTLPRAAKLPARSDGVGRFCRSCLPGAMPGKRARRDTAEGGNAASAEEVALLQAASPNADRVRAVADDIFGQCHGSCMRDTLLNPVTHAAMRHHRRGHQGGIPDDAAQLQQQMGLGKPSRDRPALTAGSEATQPRIPRLSWGYAPAFCRRVSFGADTCGRGMRKWHTCGRAETRDRLLQAPALRAGQSVAVIEAFGLLTGAVAAWPTGEGRGAGRPGQPSLGAPLSRGDRPARPARWRADARSF